MTWVGVGMAAVGAASGSMKAKAAKKKQNRQDEFRKTAIAYSPWSGMSDPGAGNFGNTDQASAMLGGGMQGAALGSMMGGFSGGGDLSVESKPTSALGGSNMVAELGDMGNNVAGMQQQVDEMRGINGGGSSWAGQQQGIDAGGGMFGDMMGQAKDKSGMLAQYGLGVKSPYGFR